MVLSQEGKKEEKQMTLEQFKEIKVRKGKFYKATYQKVVNGYTKTTTTTARFVDYYNTKEVKASGKTPNPSKSNPNVEVVIKDVLTFNKNTQNYLVHLQATPNGKTITTYQDQEGNTIDKDTYYKATNTKPSAPSKFHNVKLQDLLKLE